MGNTVLLTSMSWGALASFFGIIGVVVIILLSTRKGPLLVRLVTVFGITLIVGLLLIWAIINGYFSQ